METLGMVIQKYLKRNRMTQSEFAQKLGISIPYLSQIVGGVRTPGKKLLPLMAEILNEDLERLNLIAASGAEKDPVIKKYLEEVYVSHYEKPPREGGQDVYKGTDGKLYDYRTIPVIGCCEAGVAGLWDPDAYSKGEGMYRIPRPAGMDDEQAVAFEVRGDSMTPKFEQGDVVVVSPEQQVRTCDYVVVRLRTTQEIMAKRVRFDRGLIVLESVNPAVPPIIITDRKELEFCYRIVIVHLASAK